MQSKSRTGGVQLYILNEKAHPIPAMNQLNNNVDTSFWIRIGNKATKLTNVLSPGSKSHAKEYIYKLTNNSKIVTSCRDIDRGLAVAYVLPQKVRLVVKYEARDINSEIALLKNDKGVATAAAASTSSGERMGPPKKLRKVYVDKTNYTDLIGNNVIKVTAIMENRGDKTNIFTLKEVVDSYLGEGDASHFSTNNNKYIKSESYFNNFVWEGEKAIAAQDATLWIETASNKVGAKFITAGRGVSPIEKVVAASVDNLNQEGIWQNAIRVGRNFDSFINYGNSGFAIFYPQVRLGPKEKAVYTYYIAFSVTDYFDSESFISALTSEVKKEEPPPAPEEPKVDIDLTLSDNGERGKFIIDETEITDDKLNYDYVQSLIDRINEIENNGSDFDELNKNELLRLNTEIDIILEKLKK